MKLIDYVFYRVYSFYKRSKSANPVFMGCLVLAVASLFSLLSLITITSAIFKADLQQYKSMGKPVVLIFLALAVWLFWKRYNSEQTIITLAEKYREEEDSIKRRRALYITLYIATVLLTPMVYGYLKHNLKMDI
jgi:uncharacterized membrane protein YkvI